jgi:carboxypeptidase C (cathepsin A)
MLYLESPAGVGYSVFNTTNDTSYAHNDMSQSIDAMTALLDWYNKFPELISNPLYISGESYGGIYVPYLAWQIYQHNLKNEFNPTKYQIKIKLEGFMVGNGATDWDYDVSPSFPEVVYNF